MKISTILDFIDSGYMALPEFQRGYVWNRDQVRGLMDSLYRRHPIGSLLVWTTASEGAQYRGDGEIAPGVVKLLLDGQQRMTTLYGILRGQPPKFFDGNERAFTGLYFNLESEEFSFYMAMKMQGDPRWLDVTQLMIDGMEGVGQRVAALGADPELSPKLGTYTGRLTQLLGIRDIEVHAEEVTGQDKTIDVVVDIFNRVNSGGTKLSKGDLALAKVCADWPDARTELKTALAKWRDAGYQFNLDWLLRVVNTVTTGEARFNALHGVNAEQFQEGLVHANRAVDSLLNTIAGRFGLDHDRVFFGRYAIPVMAHYLHRRGGQLADARERDKLLFWYLQSAMFGRFSGSTESYLNRDLELIEELDGGLDRLIEELRLWRGGLRIEPGHFGGWSRGARFYPVLYLLTRVGQACDWGSGLPLEGQMLGRMSRLEMHHIFPKAVLYKAGYPKSQVNAVANFCFQTKDSNLRIRDRAPELYFPEVEHAHPGALASQWVPTDPALWQIDAYPEFLEARRELLASAANELLEGLLHGEGELAAAAGAEAEQVVPLAGAPIPAAEPPEPVRVPGSIDSTEEEETLLACNIWIVEHGLPEGRMQHELLDPQSNEPLALLDLAWPDGLQPGLSRPVALLLDEPAETLAMANAQGFRYFTDIDSFKQHVHSEVLAV
jgi:hypothetical protein